MSDEDLSDEEDLAELNARFQELGKILTEAALPLDYHTMMSMIGMSIEVARRIGVTELEDFAGFVSDTWRGMHTPPTGSRH